jgi:hypothetical protein
MFCHSLLEQEPRGQYYCLFPDAWAACQSVSWLLIIHNPLVAQLLKKLADVGANLGRIGVAELGL